jgi:hypothetical protein
MGDDTDGGTGDDTACDKHGGTGDDSICDGLAGRFLPQCSGLG